MAVSKTTTYWHFVHVLAFRARVTYILWLSRLQIRGTLGVGLTTPCETGTFWSDGGRWMGKAQNLHWWPMNRFHHHHGIHHRWHPRVAIKNIDPSSPPIAHLPFLQSSSWHSIGSKKSQYGKDGHQCPQEFQQGYFAHNHCFNFIHLFLIIIHIVVIVIIDISAIISILPMGHSVDGP